ncbi:MAG TPA: hypothetical protein VFK41_07765 [Nocardioidaceae bacterium]|nr:hypothetical protein [Nocardioidaceae bacterium]
MNRRRNQRGLAAVLISLSMVALLVVAGMAIDFGMVRYQRQINKAVADAAVAAGMRSFDRDDGQVYTMKGVCDTLSYLKVNEPALASLPPFAPCSSTPQLATTCNASVPSTHASYSNTTADGRYQVTVKAPYTMPDPKFPEDAFSGVATDIADACLQLGVIITELYKPGLGSFAVKEDIKSTIRSVGRVKKGPGKRSPALLLLDRTNCFVLTTGTNSNSLNQNNFIRVLGAGSGNAVQPGTIHADSNGSNCGNNETIFMGKRLDGIVAYAAPVTNEPGIITSYAKLLGVADAIVSDGSTRTFGSNQPDYGTTGVHTKVQGLGLITRSIVDDRYLAPLHGWVDHAKSVFATLTSPSAATAQGFAVLGGGNCTGANQPAINALTSTKVYVNCSGYRGTGTFTNATEVFFTGTIDQQAATLIPKATRVYVTGGTGDAIRSTGNPFRMHHNGNASCPGGTQSESALLFIRSGAITNNNGLFQACNTAVIMMSGDGNKACLPAVGTVAPPTTKPCPGASAGNGFLDLSGGGSGATQIDWTAPNTRDADMSALSQADKQAAWNQLEDLAFWSEAYGSSKFTMSGGAGLHLVGVFMTPNADPFTVTGGGSQTLTNAQYVATKFEVNGGASLTMRVDPNNTVTLPKLTTFDLVR